VSARRLLLHRAGTPWPAALLCVLAATGLVAPRPAAAAPAASSARPHTLSGDVSQVTVPGFLDGRPVWIYLPPGYRDHPERRYPVLYMADGQNVFDAATSFAGEWRADETLEREILAGRVAPLIVVAVANGGARRLDEYTPWADPRHGGGGAAAHLRAWRAVLVPWVDARYRTLHDPAHRAVAGSSLGGLLALYAVFAHPDLFGAAAALSPSLWWDDHHLLAWLAAAPTWPEVRIYADMGGAESGDADHDGVPDAVADLRSLRDLLLARGLAEGRDLRVVEEPGAPHHESAWARRLPGALRFLFPGEAGEEH